MTIPTCCVTGAIPGDGGACGDCDPCIMGEPLVPQSVKAIIAEKNSLLNQIGELHGEIDTIKENLLSDVGVHINMMRGTIAKPSWENLRHLYPRIYDLEEDVRRLTRDTEFLRASLEEVRLAKMPGQARSIAILALRETGAE